MAFMVSKTQQASISELPHSGGEIQTESANNRVTSQLYLKASESLNREIVLRRIRNHKTMNKPLSSIYDLLHEQGSPLDPYKHSFDDPLLLQQQQQQPVEHVWTMEISPLEMMCLLMDLLMKMIDPRLMVQSNPNGVVTRTTIGA